MTGVKPLSKLLPLLMLCCAGCFLSYSVSGHKAFRPYIGQTVTLTRPLLLVEHHSALFGSHGVMTLGFARYGLAEPSNGGNSETVFAKLPIGYAATIDSVHEEIVGDNDVPVAYGHLIHPATGQRGSFAYACYGYTLPWQLATVR